MPWSLLFPWIALAAPVETIPLDEALARLEADSPDLAAIRARTDQAEAVTRQVGAALLPVVRATGSWTRNDDEVVLSFAELLGQLPIPAPPGALPAPVVIQPEEVLRGGLSARVPLLAPSAWNDRSAAIRTARAAEASEAAARASLQAALVRAAAAARMSEGFVAAAERAVALAEAHRDLVARGVAAGTERSLSLLQAEDDVLRRRSELAQARADLATAEELVGSMLGADGPARIALPDALVAPTTPESPQLAAARWSAAAARSRVASAWSSHLPTVSAFGVAQAATIPFPTGKDTAWSVGVEATWTLYDGGLRYGRLEAARAGRAEADAILDREALRVGREVREAERSVEVARERLTLAEGQLATASEARRLAALGLEAGTVSALEAREAEQRAFQADVGREAARAQLLAAIAALGAARGAAW